MKIIIDPKDFDVFEECRIVILTVDKEVYRDYISFDGRKIDIDDAAILQRPQQFRFKIQTRQDGKWRSVTKVLTIPNQKIQDIPPSSLKIDSTFLTNDDHVSGSDVFSFIQGYEKSKSQKSAIKKALLQFIKSVHLDRNKVSYPNAETFIEVARGYRTGDDFLKEMAFYVETNLMIKRSFSDLGITKQSYGELYNKMNAKVIGSINRILNHCYQHRDLQSAYILSGSLKSFIGNRSEAAKEYSYACRMTNSVIEFLTMDLGAFTYVEDVGYINESNHVEFLNDLGIKSDLVILISMDTKFLKAYGPYLFFIANALQKYHFHFHIIGNDSHGSVEESTKLFDAIRRFRGQDGIKPSFSYEPSPRVPSPRTYYACGRYLIADKVMNMFGADVYIMDADLTIDKDPKSYFEALKKFDVALPMMDAVMGVSPWRRFMAGNVYVKNNDNGMNFINTVKRYILNNIDKDNSWMLDQNALDYAFEKCREVNYGNTQKFSRPTKQYPINSLIEKLD